MPNNAFDKIKQEIENMQNLIIESLDSNYLSDKVYTKLTSMIGHIDDLHKLAAEQADADQIAYLDKMKDMLDKLCRALATIQSKPKALDDEDLMHPTGDYYNEDNSVALSTQDKASLRNIISEH